VILRGSTLALLTILVLAGTASGSAGYVADAACAGCHPAKFASYQAVGMAQSMRRPRAEVLIEDFRKGRFFHAPSQCYYEMAWEGGKLLFRRYQLDGRGRRINAIEQQVDWIVGSGHRARVYLYRASGGELYQLPVAWYTQQRAWGMAPGYDRADNDGITRPVRRECLFCHNAYPKVKEGSDGHWSPQLFPAELPEGTGCQRCHGPGAEHVQAGMSGGSEETLHATIVSPARLTPALRDAVCFQCHLQPAVALIGARRFDRGDYSFRPGQPLEDYLLHVDVDEPGRTREQRFEINHHAYRLRQSACYLRGGITCISCHDPHQPLKSDRRLAGVTSVCLGCHQQKHPPLAGVVPAGDCVSCHMPRRRTQDVVRVVMTDHRIQRRPPPGDLLAPLAERDPEIHGVVFLDPDAAPPGALGDAYRAVTMLRAMPRNTAATEQLRRSLPAISSPVPRFDLIAAQLQQRQFPAALATLATLGAAVPADPRLLDWRGIATVATGDVDRGLADLHAAATADPGQPEYHFNLGAVLHRAGRESEALPSLTRAIELRPNFVSAWILRAETLAALQRKQEAIADLRHALAIDPRQTRAYTLLARLLTESGQAAEAQRWLEHGARVGVKP